MVLKAPVAGKIVYRFEPMGNLAVSLFLAAIFALKVSIWRTCQGNHCNDRPDLGGALDMCGRSAGICLFLQAIEGFLARRLNGA